MVSGPTPPSTSMSKEGNILLNHLTWVTHRNKRTVGQNHRQREAGRERLSGSGPVGQSWRCRDSSLLINYATDFMLWNLEDPHEVHFVASLVLHFLSNKGENISTPAGGDTNNHSSVCIIAFSCLDLQKLHSQPDRRLSSPDQLRVGTVD